MRHRPTAWAFVYLLNPDLTSRAMNSSSVALCRQDQDPILSSPPRISRYPSSAARLALLDQYESYGSQRSAIRGIVFGTLNLRHSSQTSTDNTRFSSKPKLNGYGVLKPNSAERSAMRIMYGTPSLLPDFTTPIFIPIHCCNVIALPLEIGPSAC